MLLVLAVSILFIPISMGQLNGTTDTNQEERCHHTSHLLASIEELVPVPFLPFLSFYPAPGFPIPVLALPPPSIS